MNLSKLYENMKNFKNLTNEEVSFLKFKLDSTLVLLSQLGPTFQHSTNALREDISELNKAYPEVRSMDTSIPSRCVIEAHLSRGR